MGILSAIGRVFKAIFKAIISFIKKYWKIILAVILIVCVIYFAPAIAGWLTSVGAPTWLSSAFTWIGANITPLLSSAWSGITALAGGAWDAFSSASLGTKALLVLGAAAALAPEETEALIGETMSTLVGVAGTVAGGILSGITSSPWGIAALAFGVWWFFLRDKDDETVITQDEADATGAIDDAPNTIQSSGNMVSSFPQSFAAGAAPVVNYNFSANGEAPYWATAQQEAY